MYRGETEARVGQGIHSRSLSTQEAELGFQPRTLWLQRAFGDTTALWIEVYLPPPRKYALLKLGTLPQSLLISVACSLGRGTFQQVLSVWSTSFLKESQIQTPASSAKSFPCYSNSKLVLEVSGIREEEAIRGQRAMGCKPPGAEALGPI